MTVINTAFSQSCLPDGSVVTTQTQIDNFQVNYPDCSIVEGNVSIEDDNDTIDNITNLLGLNQITSIGGGLNISECDSLISLTGLDNITDKGTAMTIRYNDKLTSIASLANLTSPGYLHFQIIENQKLTCLTGLENINSVIGSIYINDNPSLQSLYGIHNIHSI